MDFKELHKIAKTHISLHFVNIPGDAFKIARCLNIRIKNSLECKQDFPDSYPLNNCNAIYAMFKGEYTIYYDEKYAYKNFAIAHEIAHHLLNHRSDGTTQHNDANLLAAIITAPPELVKKNKIKNAIELSEKCLIPYNVACKYWSEIKDTIRTSYRKHFFIIGLVLTTIILTSAVWFTLLQYTKSNNIESVESNVAIIQKQNTTPIINDETTYYITSSGTHYHIKDCQYVKYKTNVTVVKGKDILNSNLLPCKRCIKE